MDNLLRIKIKGFKSIKELDLEIKPINVLIGANGSPIFAE
jgi:predicted ATPase